MAMASGKDLSQLNWLPFVAITLILGLPLFGFFSSLFYFETDSKVFLIGSP